MAVSRKKILFVAFAVVGFGLLQAARLFDANTGPYSHHEYALLGLIADGCTFLVIALLSYFVRVERPSSLLVFGAIFAAVYLAMSMLSDGVPEALFAVMQIAAGIGWSLNVLCWMAVFEGYKPRMALPMIAAAYAVDVAIQPIKSVLPQLSSALLVVTYTLSILLLSICLHYGYVHRDEMREIREPKTTLAEAYSRMRRAIAGAFIFSAVCGFVVESDYIISGLEYAQTDLTAAFCFAAALGMLITLLAFKVEKANIDYVSPVSTLCIATVLVLRGVMGGDNYVAGSAMTATLVSYYVFLWLMFISEAQERMLPAFFLLGMALAVARLSVALGRVAAQLMHAHANIDSMMVSMLGIWVLALALALIFVCYLRYTSRFSIFRVLPGLKDEDASKSEDCSDYVESDEVRLSDLDDDAKGIYADSKADLCLQEARVRTKAARPDAGSGQKAVCLFEKLDNCSCSETVGGDGTADDVPTFDDAFRRLSLQYGFSMREQEVLREFAMGRSAHYIAEWYMLSEHTVKTHIRRAYAKANVHSRQELLNRIEEMQAELFREQG